MSENVVAPTVQDTPAGAVTAPQIEPGTPAAIDPGTATDGQAQPIAYEAFTLPEGMAFEADTLTEINSLFGELKLPQDHAQRVLDQLVKSGPAMLKGAVEKMLLTEHEAQAKAWEQEARDSADFGGAAFTANQAKAQTAIAAFGTPGFKALLESSGLTNHPEVLRTFRDIGERISEGSHVPAGESVSGGNPLETLYNHPTSKAQLKYAS